MTTKQKTEFLYYFNLHKLAKDFGVTGLTLKNFLTGKSKRYYALDDKKEIIYERMFGLFKEFLAPFGFQILSHEEAEILRQRAATAYNHIADLQNEIKELKSELWDASQKIEDLSQLINNSEQLRT